MSEPMILEVMNGFDKGRQIPVPPSGAILGRGSSSDIKLDETTLSRVHCRFALENGKWVVEDFNSRSGVVVNGQKTSGSPLKQGDKIKLGRLRLEVVSLPELQCCFQCQCGKVYIVKPSLAGKTAVCKKCGAKTKVPKATASEDAIRFPCKCGKVHTVKAAFAGKTVVCKQCGVKTMVPKATALAFAAPAKRARGVEARLDATKVIDPSDIDPDAPD